MHKRPGKYSGPYTSLILCCVGLTACSGPVSDPNSRPQQQIIRETTDPGQALYQQKCNACHGSNGAAGIGNAANLKTSSLDRMAIIQVISAGRNAMPSFRGQLNTEETEQVAAYVAALRSP